MPRIVPVRARRLRRVFEKAGFVCVRVEGDHFVYTKEGVPRPVVIPDWPEVPSSSSETTCAPRGYPESSISPC